MTAEKPTSESPRARIGRCEFCKADVVLSTPEDLSCAESPDGWHYVPDGSQHAPRAASEAEL